MKLILAAALLWLVVLWWNYRVRRWWNFWDWLSGVYYQSRHWKRYRSRKLRLSGYKCKTCGRVQERGYVIIQVNHLHYRSLWHESLKDTDALCTVCHAKADDKKRQKRRRK